MRSFEYLHLQILARKGMHSERISARRHDVFYRTRIKIHFSSLLEIESSRNRQTRKRSHVFACFRRYIGLISRINDT